ncbi:L,D-transpeptidase [Candidatus Roizmanbacteria bacterium]|nr:MAG: L,D-transpeptidase [Candidatus Roizmanbacteria bacterium]
MRYIRIVLVTFTMFLFVSFAGIHAEEIITTEKLITVDTSNQMLYAWEDGKIVRSTPVSTGLSQTPTVKSTYKTYWKLPVQRMRGYSSVNGYYDHPGVTDVMYFYKGYAIHGAYWHNNFGTPMSNGCVNVSLAEADWLYEWAPIGTKVVIY